MKVLIPFVLLIALAGDLSAQRTPYAGAIPIPGVLQAENYDGGGQGVTFHDTTPGNAFGVYRFDNVDVGAITSGGYFIGAIDTGEWTEYTVNVATTGTYMVTVRWASANPASTTFHLLMNGVNISGTQSITSTGDWQTFATKTFAVPLNAGNNQILRVSFDTGSWNLDSLQFTAAPRGPFAGAIPIPGLLQAENYDTGGEGVSWHDTTTGNAFGVYRIDDVDVGPIAAGGYFIGAIDPGEWTEYTVNVASAGSYTITVRWASAYTGSTTFHLLMNGADVSGPQSVTSTGDWQTFNTKTFAANLSAGANQILRVSFDTGSLNLDSLQFTAPVSCTSPSVTNPTSGNFVPGGTASFSVTAAGNPAPTLRWYKDGVALTDDGVHISGSTGPILQIFNIELWRDGGQYTVVATNSCNSVTSAPATLRIPCVAIAPGSKNPSPKPELVSENVYLAMKYPGVNRETCDWRPLVQMSMLNNPNFAGSYNLPVIAAAVAYIKEPVTATWDMNVFWKTYLGGELGEPLTNGYYGGRELGSYDYHHINVVAVLAVHYWAYKHNDAPIQDLAKRWLKATFALHALAAMPQTPLTFHAKGQMMSFAPNYFGPYVATAGERSAWGFWLYLDRSVMFSNAVGLPTNSGTESPSQTDVRTFVQSWPDVYGLTSAEKSYLQNIVNNGTLVPYLDGGSVPYLKRDFFGNLHTIDRLIFVGWSRTKAALIKENNDTNTVPTFGAAYFLDPDPTVGRQSREAHFLYPWTGLFTSGKQFNSNVCNGTAFIDLSTHSMQASHLACAGGTHPAETTTITNLPAAPPNYVVTLDPSLPVACTPACP